MQRLGMAGGSRNPGQAFRRNPAVYWILCVTTGLFILDFLLQATARFRLSSLLGLNRHDLFQNWAIYQPFTYAFLHDVQRIGHIFFNMLIFWMFGRELEDLFTTPRFLIYYFACAVAGGLLHVAFSEAGVIGASGAVFGLLLAYGVTWPNRRVLLFFFIPIRIKYLVLILAVMEFYLSLNSLRMSSMVAHWAHLGGLLGGGLMLLYFRKHKAFVGLEEMNRRRKLRRHQARIDARIREKEQVDELLDKISAHGIESLTGRERRFLDRTSHKYSQDEPPG